MLQCWYVLAVVSEGWCLERVWTPLEPSALQWLQTTGTITGSTGLDPPVVHCSLSASSGMISTEHTGSLGFKAGNKWFIFSIFLAVCPSVGQSVYLNISIIVLRQCILITFPDFSFSNPMRLAFDFKWDVSTTTGWTAMTFGADITSPNRINCNDLCDPLTFNLVPSSVQQSELSNALVYYLQN